MRLCCQLLLSSEHDRVGPYSPRFPCPSSLVPLTSFLVPHPSYLISDFLIPTPVLRVLTA
jgi:hypothetical protein